jgi:hypothetical protein
MASASSWSCVTMIVVMPTRRCRARTSARRPWRTRASRADSGSSRSRSPGRGASARARATRCCSPPESCAGYFSRCRATADQVQQLVDAALDVAPEHAPGLEAVGDVPRHGQVREEGIRLEDDAVIPCARRQPRHIAAVHQHAPGVLPLEAGDDPEQGRLPAATRPEEADELARLDGQRHPREDHELAELLGNPVEGDRGLGGPTVGARGAHGGRPLGGPSACATAWSQAAP